MFILETMTLNEQIKLKQALYAQTLYIYIYLHLYLWQKQSRLSKILKHVTISTELEKQQIVRQ